MAENRGGARPPDGKARPVAGPGKYAQRSDMSQPGPAKPQGQGAYVPPGLPYGSRQQMEQAQQTVPAPALRTPPPQSQSRPAPGGAPAMAVPSLAQILARPTNRPQEPSTAGIPSGPGPNSIVSAPATGSVSAIIERAAMATGSATLRELAQRAQASGQ